MRAEALAERIITSRSNPRVKWLRELSHGGRWAAEGLALAEGVRLAEEALDAWVQVALAVYTPRLSRNDRGALLVRRIRDRGLPELIVTDEVLESISDTESPQGILLVLRPVLTETETVFGGPDPALVVAVEGLQDPGNLGTIMRSAEAFGARAVAVTSAAGASSGAMPAVHPYHPKVLRASMGAAFRLKIICGLSTSDFLARCRAGGVQVVAAAAGGNLTPRQVDWSLPTTLLIGNEGAGLDEATLASADLVVRIPMPGRAESLNAAVAASVLLYEASMRRSGTTSRST